MFTLNFFVLQQNTNIIVHVACGFVLCFQSGQQDNLGWPPLVLSQHDNNCRATATRNTEKSCPRTTVKLIYS
jgi:hypothetical protein